MPHSGHRSALARRSYPQAGHRRPYMDGTPLDGVGFALATSPGWGHPLRRRPADWHARRLEQKGVRFAA